jgi:hypothetical protein
MHSLHNGQIAHLQGKHSGGVTGAAGMPDPAMLRGFVDNVGIDLVEGWAQDSTQPEEPVCLDVLIENVFMTRILANGHRADLLATGQGSGCHAFSVRLPFQMTPRQREGVIVRRSSDRAVVPWTNEALASVAG